MSRGYDGWKADDAFMRDPEDPRDLDEPVKPSVPIGCRERANFIERCAEELTDQFFNGNRKCMLERLEELPPRVALAVLACIMETMSNSDSSRTSLAVFLLESA